MAVTSTRTWAPTRCASHAAVTAASATRRQRDKTPSGSGHERVETAGVHGEGDLLQLSVSQRPTHKHVVVAPLQQRQVQRQREAAALARVLERLRDQARAITSNHETTRGSEQGACARWAPQTREFTEGGNTQSLRQQGLAPHHHCRAISGGTQQEGRQTQRHGHAPQQQPLQSLDRILPRVHGPENTAWAA